MDVIKQINYALDGFKDIKALCKAYGIPFVVWFLAAALLLGANLLVLASLNVFKDSLLASDSSFIPFYTFFYKHMLVLILLIIFDFIIATYLNAWMNTVYLTQALSFIKNKKFLAAWKTTREAFGSTKTHYVFISLLVWGVLLLVATLLILIYLPSNISLILGSALGYLFISVVPGAYRSKSLSEALLNPLRLMSKYWLYLLIIGFLSYVVALGGTIVLIILSVILTVIFSFLGIVGAVLSFLIFFLLLFVGMVMLYHLVYVLEAPLVSAPLA